MMIARFHSLAGITSLSVAVILALTAGDPLAADEARDQSIAHERVRFIRDEWTAKDGLPNPIHRLLQTHDGYLWLGTEDSRDSMASDSRATEIAACWPIAI